jgi:hypothetical protein
LLLVFLPEAGNEIVRALSAASMQPAYEGVSLDRAQSASTPQPVVIALPAAHSISQTTPKYMY